MNSFYVSNLNNKEIPRKDDPNEIYKRPIPLDMINQFVGLDSRILHNDSTVQKQAFDQGYKNFWSFVDWNMKKGKEAQESLIQGCPHSNSKIVKPNSSIVEGSGCSGVSMSYQEAREKANQLGRIQ